MNIKSYSIILSCLFLSCAYSQTEITEVKRYMSQGEKPGYKITLPNQTVEKYSKAQKDYFKSIKSELIKSPKGSNEIIYKNVYLAGEEKPQQLFILIDQEGKNVGWTGYFFDEKEMISSPNKEGITKFLKQIYNLSMIRLYDDSIFVQMKFIKEAQSELKSKSKDADKNQKNIINAKDDIRNAESEIEKNKAAVESATAKLGELKGELDAAKSKVQAAESEMEKVKQAENEIKELMSKHKKQSKNLNELQKDPASNANLIIAQESDLQKMKENIALKTSEYKASEANAKSQLKNAEKDLDKTEDNLKNAEKSIKRGNENIKDKSSEIVEKRNTIESNEKQAEIFRSAEKGKAEEQIKELEKRLEELKSLQNSYR